MLEQGLIKRHFLGRDGFIWWIGQVAEQSSWAVNLAGTPTDDTKEQHGFDFRYKVRIMGYHTGAADELSDEELPWASVMLPVTAGTSGGARQTPQLRQGNYVYGFFIDGEDAQTPIIMGVIGYNQYTALLKDIPEGGGFKPYSGYTVDDTVPKNAQGTTQEEATAVPEDVDVSETNNKKVVESPAGLVTRKDGASLEQHKGESKTKTLPTISNCEPAPLVGIQREVKNMLAGVEEAKKSVTDWKTKVSTSIDNVEDEIAKIQDDAIRGVSGHVKRITEEIEKNALKKINDTLSDTYHDVFPTELPQLKQEVEKANDELACLFKNIMKNLTGMVGGFLKQIMDRFITTPLCAIENFIGSLLGKISGLIDSAIGSVMAPIKSLLAGMGAATSAIDDFMGFATDALSFLSCDEDPRCSEVKEWNPTDGPQISATLDLFSIVNKAKQAAGLVQNAVEGAANIGDTLSNIAKNADFSDAFTDTCNVGPVFCGPPTVEFIGGGGSGATGNVIVSSITTLLGVDIITPGGGYIGPPRLKFNDSCNRGKGATGRAVIGEVVLPDGTTTTGVTGVIIDDTGIDYLPSPDGSQGGDGRTWAESDETTVKREDGTYDTPYKPGTVVNLNPGDEWTPAGRSPILIDSPQSITTPPPPDKPSPGSFPSTGTGDYPVILEIEDINIVDSGFGYDSNDEIVVGNGAHLKLKTDDLGSVTGVDVLNGGIGFTEDPNIYIKSDTGYNAKMIPVFKVNKVGEEISPEAVAPGDVIQVVDCVGKF